MLWNHTPPALTFTDTDPNAPLDDAWCVQLGTELKTLPIIHNLIRILSQQSYTYSDILDRIGRRLHLPLQQHPEYCELLLDSIFALIGAARSRIQRPDSESLILPWVTLRIQVWFRELKRMVASVESQPKLLYSDDLTAEMREKTKTLPVMHCRDCGATGWGAVQPSQSANKLIANDLRGFYKAFFNNKPLVSVVFPVNGETNHPDMRLLCTECLTINLSGAKHCHSCHSPKLISVLVPDVVKTITRNGQTQSISSHDCPFCGNSNGLSILGSQAASLTSATIGTLYTTPFNTDKKLLTFSDSVQDAAHRAGFYNARTYRTTLRTAIFQLIRERTIKSPCLTLQELVTEFPEYWQQKINSTANYIATFLPNDLQWLRDWDTFVNSDRLDLAPNTNLLNLVKERLVWEIVTQFGLRAAIGPSLERSGVCSVSFNNDALNHSVKALHLQLSNEIEALRHISFSSVRQFLLGLLHHLRHRGGILQPATKGNYITDGGNTFIWSKLTYMPRLGPSTPAPKFFVNATAKTDRFERVIQIGKQSSWCEDWTRRVFTPDSLLLKEQIIEILHNALNSLVESGLLEMYPCGQGRAWGIPLSMIEIQAQGQVLACDRCHHQLTLPQTEDIEFSPQVCQTSGCTGHYQPDPRNGLAYYRQLYQQGEIRRIVAQEHTGLLTRSNRERLEQRFINSDRYCDPNLISATSTLEMGINIGDLSSVLLCSVPPSSANFQQRIGRAGRKAGNAFVGVVANGKAHDLFFYTDPTQMLDGSVEAAGCYLNAAAILERQLTAFCLDCWVARGIARQDFSYKINDILNTLQKQDQTRFPYTWLNFIKHDQSQLLTDFLALFSHNTIDEPTQEQIRSFMESGQEQYGLDWRILDRLQGVQNERKRLQDLITHIAKRIKDLKAEPQALQDPEKLEELEREKAGFQGLIQHINQKNIFNFLTDEGLLPNYSFPEAGVTLRSIILRKIHSSNSTPTQKNSKGYETSTYSYERPSQVAIRELVPGGVFYAEGRCIKIDQIDLKLSQPQEWRICRNCSYATPAFQPEAHQKTCPRCGDVMWSDQGRLRQMLRLTQVMATTTDKESRFGDDSEDRNISFFERHLLVDFAPAFREQTFLVDHPDFPFGFEYISRTNFREINLGESLATGETVEMGGEKFTTRGFRVCSHCGKVMKGNKPQDHTISCKWRDKPEQAKALDVLYLYREFESESIRFLMPDESFWTPQGENSFIAAIQLGLKRKFRGKVDHLHTTITQEPQPHTSLRKSFLYLFDTVPGGTGYLRQLIQKPQELQDVFQQALTIMKACSCKERHEDGCYQCLFAYRNSFYQDYTSRKTAENLLSKLLQHWSQLKETSEGLSAIRINSNFESELERRFIEAIARYNGRVYQGEPPVFKPNVVNGKTGYYLKIGNMAWTIETQVTLGEEDGVNIPSRADFVIRPASSRISSLPLVIFTDGWEYHHQRIAQDFQQRLAILRSGQFWCWSLTWDDVAKQVDKNHRSPIISPDGLDCQLNNSKFQQAEQQFYAQYQCSHLRPLETEGSFEWLMYYLAQPDSQNWQNWALLRTLAQANSAGTQSQLDTIAADISAEAIAAWEVPPKFITGVVKVSQNLRVFTLVDSSRHRQLDGNGSLVLVQLDDVTQWDTGGEVSYAYGTLRERTEIQGDWQAALRLLNLYQFLPHSYAVTTSTHKSGITPSAARMPSSTTVTARTHSDRQWEQVRELTVEAELLPAIDRMSQLGWLTPEVGYELENERGTVVAIAELAWLEAKIAVTLTPEDADKFTQAHWQGWLIEDFLSAFDTLSSTLKGVS
ncbi:Zn-binding domain-containing protein [Nodularia spumigena]|uniref:Zn-binding domain-containing protein n=1 Tax=Nodularia spumigena UHCC 0060 TaxID=3110300 RepID=A0ABU5UJU0_NODSP|nr:Zn-binding domain-containing protein [Nodularia spumigena]MEA5523698.1 Zn-binding domain-containing protein [Nodularia spumigena UHCC 0143]MEA5606514.1 Zn-binding domain-containing protein [Nodularia spumigena UHCC 0060]MEA5613946.1 Zn-binding domain-containing protein [Nodularia spumigena UHCC 0040]